MHDRKKLLEFIREHLPIEKLTIEDLGGDEIDHFGLDENCAPGDTIDAAEAVEWCASVSHNLPAIVTVRLLPSRPKSGHRKRAKSQHLRLGSEPDARPESNLEDSFRRIIQAQGSEFRQLLSATNEANSAHVANIRELGEAITKAMTLSADVTQALLAERSAENEFQLQQQIVKAEKEESRERLQLASKALEAMTALLSASKKKPANRPNPQPTKREEVPMFMHLTDDERREFVDISAAITAEDREKLRTLLSDEFDLAPSHLEILGSWDDPGKIFDLVYIVAQAIAAQPAKAMQCQSALGTGTVNVLLAMSKFHAIARERLLQKAGKKA